MSQFNNVMDFVGTYYGSYDGRRASLIIAPGGSNNFYVTLHDIDRNEWYETEPAIDVSGIVNSHILSDFTLNRMADGGTSITFHRLHLHTWNIAYVSGVSVWDGVEFGMSFTRIPGP